MKIDTTSINPPTTRFKSKYFPPIVNPQSIDWNDFLEKSNKIQKLMKENHQWFEDGHNYYFRPAEHKKIILGRAQFYIQFMDFMYETYGVRYYLLDLMSRLDDRNGQQQLLFYILDAEEIHVNLEGVSFEVLKKSTIGANGFVDSKEDIPSYYTTSWEINQIFYRPSVLENTYFHTGSSITRRKAYKAMGKKVPMSRILDDNKHLIREYQVELQEDLEEI